MQSFFSIGVLFPSFPVWVSNPNQIPPTPFIRGSPGIQTQVTKENRRWRKQKQKSLAEVHPGDHPAGLGSKRPHTHPDPTPKKMGPWVFWGHFFVSHFESRCEKVFFSWHGGVKNHGDMVDVWVLGTGVFLDHLLFEAREIEAFLYGCLPKNRGKTPKWMVKIMENPIKMDDLGGKTHYFRKHPYKYHPEVSESMILVGWIPLKKNKGRTRTTSVWCQYPVGPVGFGERNHTKSLSFQNSFRLQKKKWRTVQTLMSFASFERHFYIYRIQQFRSFRDVTQPAVLWIVWELQDLTEFMNRV